jgi:transcriptional regulator with XRE-family HTH domain
MTRQGGWESTGFGGRLKALREAAGLSQEQLAQVAGCTVATVSRLERGASEPSWALVLSFCNALGARPDEFLPGAVGLATPAKPGRPRKATAEQTAPGAGQRGADAAGGKPGGRKGRRKKE